MIDLTIEKEKHITYILDNFDFAKVNDVMTKLNWTWWCTGVPTIIELKKAAYSLLNEMCNSHDDYGDYISTGGFKVTMRNDYLELDFVLEEYSSGGINYNNPNYEKLKEKKERKKKLNIIQKLNKNEDN